MRIPGADEALEHLARWAARGRWKEECMRAIAAHFEPVCAKAGQIPPGIVNGGLDCL